MALTGNTFEAALDELKANSSRVLPLHRPARLRDIIPSQGDFDIAQLKLPSHRGKPKISLTDELEAKLSEIEKLAVETTDTFALRSTIEQLEDIRANLDAARPRFVTTTKASNKANRREGTQ